MTNPILQSESFNRAAYTLSRSLDGFNVLNFEQATAQFQRSVDKLVLAMGMQAENQACIASNCAPPYVFGDFVQL